MCRKNVFYAGVLIAFGLGLLAGLLFDSCLAVVMIGAGAVCGGFWLLKK